VRSDGRQSKDRVFRFQQFDVRHEQAAMKVGTDGVLLGAWAGQGNPRTILDIGTGSGLIAMMLAQRFPEARIDAVEIDRAAAEEARGNFQRNPWHDRLAVIEGDIRAIRLAEPYSLIVANPPWYDTEMRSPVDARSQARHSEHLPAEDLITIALDHLALKGRFAVILPVDKSERFIGLGRAAGLAVVRKTQVRAKASLPVHRWLLEFAREPIVPETIIDDQLTIETEVRHVYTLDFQNLVRGFYLRFS